MKVTTTIVADNKEFKLLKSCVFSHKIILMGKIKRAEKEGDDAEEYRLKEELSEVNKLYGQLNIL